MAARSRRTNAGKTKRQTLEEHEYALAIAQSSAAAEEPKTKLERKLYNKRKQTEEQKKIFSIQKNLSSLMKKKK